MSGWLGDSSVPNLNKNAQRIMVCWEHGRLAQALTNSFNHQQPNDYSLSTIQAIQHLLSWVTTIVGSCLKGQLGLECRLLH